MRLPADTSRPQDTSTVGSMPRSSDSVASTAGSIAGNAARAGPYGPAAKAVTVCMNAGRSAGGGSSRVLP